MTRESRGSELARTARMPAPHRRPANLPAGARMLQGQRRDLENHMRQSGAQAVGRWNTAPDGTTTIPVVYVSRRAQPWVVRHRKGLLWTGVPLVILSGLYALILWVGWAWFVGGIVLSVFAVGAAARLARGGGAHTSVSVTTTTTVRVGRK